MRTFTAVLRRAGLQEDQTVVTVESLHQIVAETTVPFPIFATGFTGAALGRVTRVYVKDDVLHGDIELDGPSDEQPKTGSGVGVLLGGDAEVSAEGSDAAADSRPPASS